MVGSGFAIPGISILGLIVPTGLPVDVMVMQDTTTGQNFFVYPNGTPNLLSAIALVTNTSAQPYSASFAGAPPVCFCDGTRIETVEGEKRVEALVPGDRLVGADGRVHTVRWAGGKTHPSLPENARPIVFRPGSLGPGLPHRTLRLSPNHRLAIAPLKQWPRLAPAKAFTVLPGVSRARDDGPVGYHHVLLDCHATVLAEGVAVESLLLAKVSFELLGPCALAQIAGALGCDPEELASRPEGQPCGILLGKKPAQKKLAERALFANGPASFGCGATPNLAGRPPLIGA